MNIVVNRHARERPNQFQGGTSRPHHSVNNGSGARRRSASNERDHLLQGHDAGVRIQGWTRQCSSLHRQHVGDSCCRQSHLLPSGKHIAQRYFFIQELVEDGTITIHYTKAQYQLAGIGTNHLNKQRHRELINNIRNVGA